MAIDRMLEAADAVLLSHTRRHLTDAEQAIMQGAIADQTYEQIALQSGYALSYLKRDVGPKLWRRLSEALGEEVSKTNFRGALGRYLSQSARLDANQARSVVSTVQVGAKSPGAVASDRPATPGTDSYVQRPPLESICLETLRSPGTLVRIKAPALMGKTSLITWVMADLASQGFQVVNLSLKLAERSLHFAGLDKFLRWFCLHLTRELHLPNQLDQGWDEQNLGAKLSCSTYVEDYVLAPLQAPVVLCIDDVDLLFPYSAIYEDVFGLLRSWHEKGKTRPLWQNLRLALVYSTDVYIPLKINHSPFNVGVLVEPPEFSVDQVQQMASRSGLAAPASIVPALMGLVGGHPYLLEQALTYLKAHPNMPLAQVLGMASTNGGLYGSHLRRLWLTLQERPDLAIAFRQVVTSSSPVQVPPLVAYQLQSLGLVSFVGNAVACRFDLYRQYFADHFAATALSPTLELVEGVGKGWGRDRSGKSISG